MQYNPSIDGLRAIAVLAVVVFHVIPGRLKGGFTGVDVFFVLSGFLITSIILEALRKAQFSLSEFYLRRALRLGPNLLVMLGCVIGVASWTALPGFSSQAAENVVWALSCASNFYIRNHFGGYWGGDATSAPLLHTWSLAVEEQFYLIYPMMLTLCIRLGRDKLLVLTGIMAVGSLAACLWSTWHDPQGAYYLPHTRMWELLCGALLSMVRNRADSVRARLDGKADVLGFLGLALIAAGFIGISEASRFPGWVALVPTLGALLVLTGASCDGSTIARLLGQSWLVQVGKMSYSIYLWHWPAIVLARHYADLYGKWPRHAPELVGAAVGLLLSWGAYRWIEKPMRSGQENRQVRLLILAVGFGLCLVASLRTSQRIKDSGEELRFSTVEFHGSPYSLTPEACQAAAKSIRYRDVVFEQGPGLAEHAWRTGGIIRHHGGQKPNVVVFGSSHALMYARTIEEVCRDRQWTVAYFATDGASPLFPSETSQLLPSAQLAGEYDEARRHWLRTWRPDTLVIIDRWDIRGATAGEFERQLRFSVQEAGSFARQIVLVTQVPVLRLGEHVNLREFARWHFHRSGVLPRIEADARASVRQQRIEVMERVARDFPQIKLLRAETLFQQPDGSVRYCMGSEFYYADDDHLSQAGAELTRPLFQQLLDSGSQH